MNAVKEKTISENPTITEVILQQAKENLEKMGIKIVKVAKSKTNDRKCSGN